MLKPHETLKIQHHVWLPVHSNPIGQYSSLTKVLPLSKHYQSSIHHLFTKNLRKIPLFTFTNNHPYKTITSYFSSCAAVTIMPRLTKLVMEYD